MSKLIVLALEGVLEPADVALLCRRLTRLLQGAAVRTVVCDVAAVTRADAVTVDAVARLQLTAKRRGATIALRGAGDDLCCLLALTGLADVVPVLPASTLRVRRQTEEREQVGVEEVRDADDPPVAHPE